MNQTAACLNLSVRCWSMKCCSSAWRRSFLIVLTSPTAYVRHLCMLYLHSHAHVQRTVADGPARRTASRASCRTQARTLSVTNWPRSSVERILYGHYLPTFILIIIGIPSPTHSFIPGLKPPFSANPSHRSLSFFFFRIHYKDSPDCLLLLLSIFRLLLFSFSVFTLFSYRFRAVD